MSMQQTDLEILTREMVQLGEMLLNSSITPEDRERILSKIDEDLNRLSMLRYINERKN